MMGRSMVDVNARSLALEQSRFILLLSVWIGLALLAWLLVRPQLARAADDVLEIGGLIEISPPSLERTRAGETADVAVDTDALALLARRPSKVQLTDLPMPDGSAETFTLESFEVFTDDARIIETDGHSSHDLSLPSDAFFVGASVNDSATTIVLSVSGGSTLRTLVRHDATVVAAVGPRGTSGEHEIAGSEALARGFKRPDCGGAIVAPPGAGSNAGAGAPAARSARAGDEILEVEMLIDAGYNLYAGPMGSDSGLTSSYMTQLFGSIAGIYRRDVRLAPMIQQLVIWTAPESFDTVGTQAQLEAYRSYSLLNRGAVPRDLAHYITNNGGGGIAYLDERCGTDYGYAVSNVGGNFTFGTTGAISDVFVVAHEIGHNLGSPHTHCYVPPIDHCYNIEGGCYNGPVEPSVGEMMSYCAGVGGVEMAFRDRVGLLIREHSEFVTCLAPKGGACGDGLLDTGEECDDANSDEGDCCSNACLLLSSTSAGCDDGAFCTDDYACADSSCYHQVHVCDDGNGCTNEYCDELDDSCHAVLRDGFSCDDGFYCTVLQACDAGICDAGFPRFCGDYMACTSDVCDESGDVCTNTVLPPSTTCGEAGKAGLSMQVVSSGSKLKWKWGRGPAIDASEFGDPSSQYNNTFSLCFYDESDQLLTDLSARGGPTSWIASNNGGFKFKNSPKEPTPMYLTGMSLKPGDFEKSKLMAKGKRVGLEFPTLPITENSLRVQLRHETGPECWETLFTAPFDSNVATEFKAKK